MFAKIVGIVTAIAVFFLYFRLRGTDPVLETAIGLLISLGAGFWAYLATHRKLARHHADDAHMRTVDPPPPEVIPPASSRRGKPNHDD